MIRLLFFLILLSGCASQPERIVVTKNFPSIPVSLSKPCERLKLVDPDAEKLSVILETVLYNYSLFHECSIKVDSWNNWYLEQQKIFKDQQ